MFVLVGKEGFLLVGVNLRPICFAIKAGSSLSILIMFFLKILSVINVRFSLTILLFKAGLVI